MVTTERWRVATYWFREGEYGTWRYCKSKADAEQHAEEMKKRGFGKAGRDEIRIQRVKVDTRVF